MQIIIEPNLCVNIDLTSLYITYFKNIIFFKFFTGNQDWFRIFVIRDWLSKFITQLYMASFFFFYVDCKYNINLLYKMNCAKSIVYIIYNDF